MTKITPPASQIPVGTVTINGQRFDVQQHPEFVRFFFDLFRRVGGTDATTNADLEQLVLASQYGVFRPREAPEQPADMGYVRAFAQDPSTPQEPPSIPYVASFLPRVQEQAAPVSDASALLCARVFAKR